WNRQRDYLVSFSGKMADGIILVPCMATNQQIAAIPGIVRETPMVYVDRSPLRCQVDSVLIDNVRASEQATRHLLDLGHRRVAIITEPLNLLNAADRLNDYKLALCKYEITADRNVDLMRDNTENSGYRHGL